MSFSFFLVFSSLLETSFYDSLVSFLSLVFVLASTGYFSKLPSFYFSFSLSYYFKSFFYTSSEIFSSFLCSSFCYEFSLVLLIDWRSRVLISLSSDFNCPISYFKTGTSESWFTSLNLYSCNLFFSFSILSFSFSFSICSFFLFSSVAYFNFS